MSTATKPTTAADPFDPIQLSDGRKVEWHLRVTETTGDIAGIDVRYSTGVDLPGLISINRLSTGELNMPQNVYRPSISERQGAKDAVEILSASPMRAMVAQELGSDFLKELDELASAIRGRYLN